MKRKIVFFGSIGIAKDILEKVVLKKDVELLGVFCEKTLNSWRHEESVYDYCIKNDIQILDNDTLLSLNPDLGISVRYNRIIRKPAIDRFKMGIVNTHGGILPEYRGSYCNINAILNGENEFGVTLHYIDSGVDTGDIIAIKSTKIQESQTGLDLYKLSEKLCYEIMEENIDSILMGTNFRTPQQKYISDGHKCNEYKAKSTLAKKIICVEDINDEATIRVVRAFDSPVHEPAYTVVSGEKIYLRVRY